MRTKAVACSRHSVHEERRYVARVKSQQRDADAVGLDWTINIARCRRARVGDKVALQGNMDPSMLYAGHDRIRQEVAGHPRGLR